jgi:hypothetical protein
LHVGTFVSADCRHGRSDAGVCLRNLLWVRLAVVPQKTATRKVIPTATALAPSANTGKLVGQRGGPHPRTETKGLDRALEKMLVEKGETRLEKKEGTPGYPNSKLSLAAAPEEQIRYEQCNARRSYVRPDPAGGSTSGDGSPAARPGSSYFGLFTAETGEALESAGECDSSDRSNSAIGWISCSGSRSRIRATGSGSSHSISHLVPLSARGAGERCDLLVTNAGTCARSSCMAHDPPFSGGNRERAPFGAWLDALELANEPRVIPP